MNILPVLSFFVLMLNTASGSFEAWEEIKKWYEEYEYDEDWAEAREEAKEKECLELHENSTGFCFEECMFRIGYQLILIDPSEHFYFYRINLEKGIRYLETQMLRANVTEKKEHMYFRNGRPRGVIHDNLQHHLRHCGELHTGFVLPHKIATLLKRNRVEEERNMCYEILHEEHKKQITTLVNCLKDRIKKPEIPVSAHVSKVVEKNHNHTRTRLI